MAIGSPYTIISTNLVTSGTTTTWTTGAVTASTTAGDCIVVGFLNNDSTPSAMADSQGNTYVLAESTAGNGLRTYCYVAAYGPGGSGTATAALTSGTDTFTATYGSAITGTDLVLIARGCSGLLNTSSVVDAAGTLTALATSASPAVTGGTTLANASEWIIAVLGHANSTSAASGWSGSFATTVTNHGSGLPFLEFGEWIVSSTTAVDASCSITSSGKWALDQVALQAASSGTTANAQLAASTGAALGEDDSTATGSVSLNMTIQGI